MTNIDQKARALRYYDLRNVSREISEPVIDAFVEHGFVLTDIGGGDIVWEIEYFHSKETTGVADLTLSLLGENESGLVEDLDKGVVNVQVQTGDGGGFYFAAVGARQLLDTHGDFNFTRRAV